MAGDFEEDDLPALTSCPIVAAGASAGGLEAFTGLLQHLPIDTGMAFVFIANDCDAGAGGSARHAGEA